MPSSFWKSVLLQLGDTVTGNGLLLVLALSSSKLENWAALVCVSLGLAVSLVFSASRPFILFQIANLLFDLLVSLSVCLYLFAGLCPPEGKEIALIPVYILLCMSRPQLTQLSGVVLGLMNVMLACVLLTIVWSDSSVVDSQLGVSLTSSDNHLVECVWIFIAAIYGSLSHMSTAYMPDVDTRIPFESILAGGVCRLIILASVGLSKSALLSLFLGKTRHTLYPHPPNYVSALYGMCLLVSCMHMASVWFQQLKALTAILSGRAYNARRLVRLQHILNAGLVGAAWGFPLHLSELRALVAGCLQLQLFYNVAR